jgi:hypothetical protein
LNDASEWGAAARRVAPVLALTVAAAFVAGHLIHARSGGVLAFDFKLPNAQRLLDGQTLYPTSGAGSGSYPYLPLWAMLAAPLTVLPTVAAQYLAGILCAAAIVAALWIIGLRDPYCYALAFCSGPVIWEIRLGNPTAVVSLLVALAYRYGGAPAGIAVALKLYAWPMLLWGLLTRGRRDLVIGLLVTVAAVLVPWALIGFDGISNYPDVLHTISHKARMDSGAPPFEIALPVAAIALGGMWVKRRQPADSFAFASLAMLAATPVLWPFYLATALLPLAIHRPRFSLAWLTPLALWGLEADGRLIATFALLAWCGLGAPALRLTRLRETIRLTPSMRIALWHGTKRSA